ncbi:uncharacterized protein FOMMEDRAFT_135678 [Fomitiporia mediterranea MF3/22]|uniref:uncharacterized protein n=1 Tax=Fomitiporia mediterranea (strain MF3/22) TaxID=694068 RepID=UPI00044091BA|nr:uncharacterized protein FOMMEDRAFT_135678 [Fomitiporia mediterranea MF3/22]EJD01471.1 hypothetical protein FOMMEDRAFT_135678 [Fomitiporia mediterranea MF3/22]
MSRFTRPPFYKPSPFDIPRPVHPLSPPETEVTADSLPPMNIVPRDMGSYADVGASSSHTRVDSTDNYQVAGVELQTPNGRFRRPSNLAYLHSGSLRGDLRLPRSATRWLVMVIPPPPISREHGSGIFLNAPARASHGVLLPLLPSLSGQLTAIAREFSFPSTTGICVYLQILEGGMQFTSRISDESWPILWGSAFDEKQSMTTMGGLPIAGRIEFDLDLRKARWFDMWLSSLKNTADAVPSVPASLAPGHRREESRTTFDQTEDSAVDDISVTIQRKVPAIRHVPRKLSLLDRIDIATPKASSRPASRAALSPTDADQPRLVLSPVVQTPTAVPVAVEDEEPETATQRVDVEKKVEKWRASSSFAKSPLVASTGQISLDPANMPNNQPLDDTPTIAAADGLEPLNLDDFTWSISSAGPFSADLIDANPLYADSLRAPSVHLDGRLEGSVCLTPTTCTSFGPPDYDVFSPVASLISRLPSPDLAARQWEDAPPTPSTATSWGAPLEWPESPAYSFRAPSVDIAARHFESRPATPSTATSWGAPLEWPDSPASSFRAPSVDLGARQFGSRPATPSTATSWGAPLEWPPSPVSPFRVHTPGVGNMFFDNEHEENTLLDRGRALRSYGAGDDEPRASLDDDSNSRQVSRPWKFVWPYCKASAPGSVQGVSTRIEPTYPCLSIYPAVYPHFDLYPAPAASHNVADEQPPHKHVSHASVASARSRNVSPWQHVWPYQKVTNNVVRPITIRLEAKYPSFDIYPTVYPHFDLYPAKPPACGTSREVVIKLESKYPTFSIYPALYPSFEIYPGHVVEAQPNPLETTSVHLKPSYPCIQPYSAVYPYFDLYPEVSVGVLISGSRQPPRKQAPHSHAEVAVKRPASPWKHVWPYQRTGDITRPIQTRLEPGYPTISLYPAVYPYFDLYPSRPCVNGSSKEIDVKLSTRYPAFSIYPAVYPAFEIYPGYVVEAQRNPQELLSVKLPASYPSFEIYSPAYPHLVIYPEYGDSGKRSGSSHSPNVPNEVRGPAKPAIVAKRSVSVTLKPSYPHLEIYSPVYPNLRVYPSLSSLSLEKDVSNICEARYPNFDIYPAVYPYFDIYRSGSASTSEYWREAPRVELNAKYPVIDTYALVYPFFDIYKSGQTSDPTPLTTKLSTKLEAKYPAFDIYPAVYPHLELYPSVQAATLSSPRRRARRSHQELVELVHAQAQRSASRVLRIPRISISSHSMRRRPRRSHKELVGLVFPPQSNPEKPRIRTSMLPTSPRDASRILPQSARPSGIPTRPSEIRRTNSLGRSTMSSSFRPSGVSGVSRSFSLRTLASVREENPANRPLTERLTQIPERKHMKRDSIVLERARHWGAPAGSKPLVPTNDSPHVTMNDLAEFPMPPLPPLPNVPNGRPASSVNRPIAKLDKTKFPFR